MRPIDFHVHPGFNYETVPEKLTGMEIEYNKHLIQWLSYILKCTKYSKFLDMFNDDIEKTYLAYRETMYSFFGCHGKCVSLPLDFKHNGGIDGDVIKDYTQQMMDVENLSIKYDREIIVFDYANEINPVHGVKGYSSMCGLYPGQWVNPNMTDYPIMVHCEYGSVRKSGLRKSVAREFNNPIHWVPVLKKYPNIKVCFAHFGGEEEWKKYNDGKESWVHTIVAFMFRYPNVYVDLSYALLFPSVLQGVKKLLADHPWMKERILFGTDYPMCVIEKDGLWKTLEAYNELDIWEFMALNGVNFQKKQ
jgi:hypothetical protein